MAKQFGGSLLADLIHNVFIYPFFYLMQVPTSSLQVFISMFCLFFSYLAAVVVQVSTPNNIQYL